MKKYPSQFLSNRNDFQAAGEHFWVHYTSELIHPVGWSYLTGHEIEAAEEYKNEVIKMIESNTYPANTAPPEHFRQVNSHSSDCDKVCFSDLLGSNRTSR